MSSSSVRRLKERGGGGAKITAVPSIKPARSTTPVNGDSIKRSTGTNSSSRPTSRIRAAAASLKPAIPPMTRLDKDSLEPRARWSTSFSVGPRGRSSSPSEFNRVLSDVRKTRVSGERNVRSASVGRSTRVLDKVVHQNKGIYNDSNAKSNGVAVSQDSVVGLKKTSEVCNELKPKSVHTQNSRVTKDLHERGREENSVSRSKSSNARCSLDSVVKVSESVKLTEKLKSKSHVGLRSGNVEKKENGVSLSLKDSGGKSFSRSSNSHSLKEKVECEDSVGGRTTAKYPSKLHGKISYLEEKVKRIASDIKRTKEMLDSNNPDASKVILSDIQETVAGIEKAMVNVVNSEKEKKIVAKVNVVKTSPIKVANDRKSSGKGLNTEEIEARFFPHHKLLRDRTILKASLESHQTQGTKVATSTTGAKRDEKSSIPIDGNLITQEFLVSSSKEQSKVTTRGGLEISEVQETDSTVNSKTCDSSNFDNGKGNADLMLTANETLEECDEQENMAIIVFEEETKDCCKNQSNDIGLKTSTGGWFVSEGESVLLAHDDGSCSFYDVANSEEKSIYKAPAEISPNLWRDCWILRAPGADGCSGRYVVAASAGNGMDAGFCSWDFYTKEVRAFHIEEWHANTRTALAPLTNNVLNRRHVSSNMAPENRQWWYKPCGPLIISTETCQKVVRMYDIRDGEHIMKWEVQNPVIAMDNSSPLQWRNRGKVVVAEAERVSLWDVGSLTPQPLLSVSASGGNISALHVNNTDAELGGGVRQRVSSSEVEGNDGVFCTQDSINVLDFRHPSGIGLKIPKYGTNVQSIFSRGDSIYVGCTSRKKSCGHQIQQFSLRKQKLFSTYVLPDSNTHPHYKAITQVWGNSNLVMGVCGLGLFVFDALKEEKEDVEKVRETIGPDDLYSPSFDYLGSRALLISRDRPASWNYLS